MKKLVFVVFALVLFGSMMFAQAQVGKRVQPGFNNQGKLSVEGTFTLNVIKPLTINKTQEGGDLGVFVESATPYALTGNQQKAIVWEMTTEPGYEFYMFLATTKENNSNKIALQYDYYQSTTAGAPTWVLNYPLLTDAGGWWTEGFEFTGLKARVTEVQALSRGASTFPFTLSVSYTQF